MSAFEIELNQANRVISTGKLPRVTTLPHPAYQRPSLERLSRELSY